MLDNLKASTEYYINFSVQAKTSEFSTEILSETIKSFVEQLESNSDLQLQIVDWDWTASDIPKDQGVQSNLPPNWT